MTYSNESDWVIFLYSLAAIAQLGERQTEDLKVPGSIPGGGIFLFLFFLYKKLMFFQTELSKKGLGGNWTPDLSYPKRESYH